VFSRYFKVFFKVDQSDVFTPDMEPSQTAFVSSIAMILAFHALVISLRLSLVWPLSKVVRRARPCRSLLMRL
jgi:hypothetical protein